MRSIAVVALAAALAACSAPVSGVGQSGIATSAPTPSPLPTSAAPAGTQAAIDAINEALPAPAASSNVLADVEMGVTAELGRATTSIGETSRDGRDSENSLF